MTPKQLEECRKILSSAKPGKLERRGLHVGRPRPGRDYVRPLCVLINGFGTCDAISAEQAEADADLIVCAVNVLPDLLDANAKLRSLLSENCYCEGWGIFVSQKCGDDECSHTQHNGDDCPVIGYCDCVMGIAEERDAALAEAKTLRKAVEKTRRYLHCDLENEWEWPEWPDHENEPNETPEDYAGRVTDLCLKVICSVVGHDVMPDMCNKPEHDVCGHCMTVVPGGWKDRV